MPSRRGPRHCGQSGSGDAIGPYRGGGRAQVAEDDLPDRGLAQLDGQHVQVPRVRPSAPAQTSSASGAAVHSSIVRPVISGTVCVWPSA